MKKSISRPPFKQILATLSQDDLQQVLQHTQLSNDENSRYWHWNELRHRPPPGALSHEQWWASLKLTRRMILRPCQLRDIHNDPFLLGLPPQAHRLLHWIDKQAAGQVAMPQPVATGKNRDVYLFNSLIEESIRSSQIEGASTTRNVAKEMLRSGRAPTDHSEKMIFNNYHAMQHIKEILDQPLSIDLICKLHRIVSSGVIDDPNKTGQLRDSKDNIHVIDNTGVNILHTPPAAHLLPERLQRLCDFANQDDDNSERFVHPMVKAILLHFMLGYDHPFVDGNGRTARALFYWYALKHQYWLLEFVSISSIIKQAPKLYGEAYLHTETDDNDTSYFLLHQLNVIKQAISELNAYLQVKSEEITHANKIIDDHWRQQLNNRQLQQVQDAVKNTNLDMTVAEYQHKYNVSYQTARTDLMQLHQKFELFNQWQQPNSKTLYFSPYADFIQRVQLSHQT